MTNKNDIILQLSDCSSSSDGKFYIGPEHLSSPSRKSWTPQHERLMEIEKEKNDAALAKVFDRPPVHFFLSVA